MQLYKHNTNRDGTHKQAGGRSVDVALFAEKLTEKLHYSFLMVGVKPKKERLILIDVWMSITIARVQYLYTGLIRVLKGLS